MELDSSRPGGFLARRGYGTRRSSPENYFLGGDPGSIGMDTAQRYLLSRTDRIGDVILSLPVAGAIKAAMPGSEVTFLVRRLAEPVVRMCPWVDDCIIWPERSHGISWRHLLPRGRFDVAVCLFPRPRVASLLKGAGIPVRVGTVRRWYSYRFNRRVHLSRSSGGRHERDFNLDLLRGLGWDDPLVMDSLCVPPPWAMEKARAILEETGVYPERDRFAVVHPGCGGSACNWPPQSYRLVCEGLNKAGLPVVVSGSEADKDIVDSVVGDSGWGTRSILGRTGLQELAAVLGLAVVFVGPSTGPMHLAASVGTPVVAIFGSVRNTGPGRWGPLGEGHRVFSPPVPVCRCRVGDCRRADCMSLIKPADVVEAVISIVSRCQGRC